MKLNESAVEEAALSWFKDLGYTTAHASHLAPGEIAATLLSARTVSAVR